MHFKIVMTSITLLFNCSRSYFTGQGRRHDTILERSPNIIENVLVLSDGMQPNFPPSTVTAIASMERASDGTSSEVETHCSGVINEDEQTEPLQQTVTMLERVWNHGNCDTVNSLNRTTDSTDVDDPSVAEAEAVFSRFSAAAKNSEIYHMFYLSYLYSSNNDNDNVSYGCRDFNGEKFEKNPK